MTEETACISPMLTHQVSAEAARAAVTAFLLDYLGNQLVAGEPLLMVSAVRAVWVVPVQFAYIHTGRLAASASLR